MNIKFYFLTKNITKTFKIVLNVILIFCFKSSLLYGQNKFVLENFKGYTLDSCKVFYVNYKFVVLEPNGNLIENVRINESNFQNDVIKISENLYVDYDNDLMHYAFFDNKGNQITQYLYKQIIVHKNNIAVFRKSFIAKTTSELWKKNPIYLEFLNIDLKPKNNTKIFDVTGSIGNRFFASEGVIAYKDSKVQMLDGDTGFLDFNGKILIKPQFFNADNFNEGLAAVSGYDINRRVRWGYVNKLGKIVIPFKFVNKPAKFSNGLAVVSDPNDNNSYFPKLGFINNTGQFVVKPIYNKILNFQNGKTYVEINKSSDEFNSNIVAMIIDTTGKEIEILKETLDIHSSIKYFSNLLLLNDHYGSILRYYGVLEKKIIEKDFI